MNGLLFNEKSTRRLVIAALAVCVFATVFLFNVNHLAQKLTYDCISYSRSIEKSVMTEVYHPHHLLYNWFKWVIYEGLKEKGYEGRALLIGQVFNSACGALGICLLFLLIVYVTKDLFTALLMSAVTSMCYGWWYCSVYNGVRILGVATLIGLFLLLLYFALSKEQSFKKNLLLMAAAALVHALAVFLHQTHLMFLSVVLVAVLFKKDTWLKKSIYYFLYCAVLLGAVVGGYLYVGFAVFRFNSLSGFPPWLTSYTKSSLWGVLTDSNTKLAAQAAERLLVGSLSGAGNAVFTLKNSLSVGILVSTLWVIALYSLFNIWRIVKKWYVVLVMCTAWLVVYVPFFIWWEPGNFEFWNYPLPAAVLLVSLAVAHWLDRFKFPQFRFAWKLVSGGAALLLAALFIFYNYFGSVLDWTDKSKSQYYKVVSSAQYLNPEGRAVFVIVGVDAVNQNLDYYSAGKYIDILKEAQKTKGDFNALQNLLLETSAVQEKRKAKMYLHADLLKLKDFAFISKRYPRIEKDKFLGFFKDKYDLIPAPDDTGAIFFYEAKFKEIKKAVKSNPVKAAPAVPVKQKPAKQEKGKK